MISFPKLPNRLSHKFSHLARTTQHQNTANASTSPNQTPPHSDDDAIDTSNTDPVARQVLNKIEAAPEGAYGNKIKRKLIAEHSSPFEAIASAIEKQGLTTLDAQGCLRRLWAHIPDRVEGAVINKAFIKSGIEQMLAVLTRNQMITAAPSDSHERAAAYETVLNAIAYIGHKFEQAYQRHELNDSQLYQMLEILGSAGENCFLAFQDAVCLITPQYAKVLDLSYIVPNSAISPLEKALDTIYLKSCNIVAQKLFDEFYPLVILKRKYALGTATAMRGHFRQHFFEHLTSYFHIPALSAKLPDSALKREHQLSVMESIFFFNARQSNKLADMLSKTMQQLFNTKCEQSEQTRNAFQDWIKNRLAHTSDFDELLPEKIFQGYSYKLQNKIAEYVFREFGYLKPYKPTMRTLTRIAAGQGDLKHFKKFVRTPYPLLPRLTSYTWFRHNPNATNKLIENAVSNNDKAVLNMLLRHGLRPQTKLCSAILSGSDTLYGRVPILNLAVESGHTEMARMLLAMGANPNAADQTLRVGRGDRDLSQMHHGRTALDIAVNENNTALANLLLIYGAKTSIIIRALEKTKETHLDLSIRKDYANLTYLLLARRPKSIIRLTSFLKLKDKFAQSPEKQALMRHVRLSNSLVDDDVKALRARVFEQNNLALLEQLLSQGLQCNIMIPHTQVLNGKANPGQIPLLNLATAYGRVDMIARLLDDGADINAHDISKLIGHIEDDINGTIEYRTPLHIAVNQNHEDAVKLLLARNADTTRWVNSWRKGVETPLDMAIRKGYPKIIQLLLTKNPTASIKLSRLDALTEMVASGDHITAPIDRITVTDKFDDDDIKTLRETVFEQNNAPLFTKLLSHGLDCNAKIPHRLVVNDKTEIGSVALLNLAAAYGRTDMVRQLLDHGADINCTDDCNLIGWSEDDINAMHKHRTPLHIAVNQNHAELIKLLLARNADTTRRAHRMEQVSETALDLAIRKRNPETIELLLRHILNHNQTVRLKLSRFSQLQDIANTSVELKEYLTHITITKQLDEEDSQTLRETVFNQNDIERLRTYLSRGLHVNTMTPHRVKSSNNTTIHWGTVPLLNLAAAYNREEMVRILLAEGANANYADDCQRAGFSNNDTKAMFVNRTPLHIAVNQNNAPIVKLLLAHNADRKIRVNSGSKGFESPLDIARRKEYPQMIQLLT